MEVHGFSEKKINFGREGKRGRGCNERDKEDRFDKDEAVWDRQEGRY